MARALLTLVAGILLAVLLAVLITPIPSWSRAIGPVLVTVALGLVVMAVTTARARLRERAEQLEEHDLPTDRDGARVGHDPARSPADTSDHDEDTDRG